MAITNAQQYQQLVNKPADGKRPGYRGDDAARSDRASGRSSGRADPDTRGSGPSGTDDKSSDRQTAVTKAVTGRLGRQDANQMDSTIFYGPKGETIDIGYQGPLNKREQEFKDFLDRRNKVNLFGLSKIFTGPAQKFSDFNASINRPFFENVIRAGKIPGLNFDMTEEELEDAYQNYMSSRLSGEIDAYGNPLNQGGDGPDQPIIPLTAQAPVTEEPELDPDSLEGMIANRTAYRFMADGGMTNDAPVEGGIMDLESGRQMYFLGKLVKKATRAVKKIAKSPIGKAALLYAGGSFLGGGGGGITGIFGKDAFLRKTLLPKLYKDGAMTGLGKIALGGALTAAPLLFQEEEEQPDYASNRGPGLDIDYIRRNPYETMGGAYRFYAEGGDVEPVAKKTMPLLDMDGKEMDLRKDGGFVPIGRMERADDVPARLSKNEFVFTADAVRNAGDGDIDKGAEVMYNMMKNLESGGEVSEESQGLDGAREMFQTSQRLEEVL